MSDAVKNELKKLAITFFNKISTQYVPDDKQNPVWEIFKDLFDNGGMNFEEFAIDHFSKQSIDDLENSLTNLIG